MDNGGNIGGSSLLVNHLDAQEQTMNRKQELRFLKDVRAYWKPKPDESRRCLACICLGWAHAFGKECLRVCNDAGEIAPPQIRHYCK